MMQREMLLFGLTLALGFASLLVVIISLFFRRQFRGFWEIPLIFVLLTLYAFGYSLEIASETWTLKILFNHIQNAAIPFIAVTWLFIAKRYTIKNYKWDYRKELWFVIIPFIAFVGAQLYSYTDVEIYYTEASIVVYNGIWGQGMSVMILAKGWLYYVSQIYGLFTIGYVTFLYVRHIFKVTGIQRKQAFAMATCGLLAALLVFPGLFTPLTSEIDLSLYILAGIGFGILYTLLHYELLSLMPAANRSMFFGSNDPILVFDDKYDLVNWNNSATQIIPAKLAYQMSLKDIFLNNDLVEAVMQHKPYSLNINGKHYVMEIDALFGKTSVCLGYVIKFLEMTSYMERIERLDYEATHDLMTDALNRHSFIERMTESIRNPINLGKHFTLIMYDFDDFKSVNDTYGHLAGDKVLTDISELVKTIIPKESLFGRYGGEEFVIFDLSQNIEIVMNFCEQLRKAIAEHDIVHGDLVLHVPVSIGVYHFVVKEDSSVTECIAKADEAMYQSKRSGKNKVTIAYSHRPV